jgi:hypothetical protein
MLSIGVVLFDPYSLIGSEPLSQTTGWGSMHQAPESMPVMTLLNHAGDGAADATLAMMSLPSHAGDGVVEMTLVVVQCRYRVMLAMVLPRWLGRGVISLSSHDGDGVANVTLAVM